MSSRARRTADRRARRALEAKIDAAGLADSVIVWDPAGTAAYQLSPSWATLVVCYHCLYGAVIPSIPSKPLTWTCSSCGSQIKLDPPGEVLEAIRPEGRPILELPRGEELRRRLWFPGAGRPN